MLCNCSRDRVHEGQGHCEVTASQVSPLRFCCCDKVHSHTARRRRKGSSLLTALGAVHWCRESRCRQGRTGHSTAKSRASGKACTLSTQPASQLSHRPRSNPRGGRGLSTVTNVIKTTPPRTPTAYPGLDNPSLRLSPGDSRLHQVDRVNHHTDLPTGPDRGTQLSSK